VSDRKLIWDSIFSVQIIFLAGACGAVLKLCAAADTDDNDNIIIRTVFKT
jgi:hypothetical protein